MKILKHIDYYYWAIIGVLLYTIIVLGELAQKGLNKIGERRKP